MKSHETTMVSNELTVMKEQSLKKDRKLADLHQLSADMTDREEKLSLR